LAQAVVLGPLTEKVQREAEQTADENKRLRDENKQLHDELDKLRATGPSTQPVVPANHPTPSVPAPARTGSAVAATSLNTNPTASSVPAARTHTVKQGETPTLIARQYGIKLDALMAANPRLDPRRLRVGQALTIPGS
jgi:LysM repeat protein